MMVTTVGGVAPLERLHVPDGLTGKHGEFRAPAGRCTIDATKDREAIVAWLRAKSSGSALTQASYRREAERVLLWSVLQRGKPISSLDADDAAAYADFLTDPRPPETWIGPKGAGRDTESWRPFVGPLSPASRKQALVVVGGFFEWLVAVGYVVANPFAGIASRMESAGGGTGAAAGQVLERTLPPAALRAVLDELAELEPNGRNRRTAIALQLLVATGMRISELVRARQEHLQRRDDGWVLRVPGRRGGTLEASLPAQLIEDMERYLVARGLPPRLSDVPPEVHLVGAIDDLGARLRGVVRGSATDAAPTMPSGAQISAGDGVGPQSIHRDLDALFERAAKTCEACGDIDLAGQLRHASSSWLRHASRLAAVRI